MKVVTDPQLDSSNDDVAGETDAEPTTTADCQEEAVISDPSVAVEEPRGKVSFKLVV